MPMGHKWIDPTKSKVGELQGQVQVLLATAAVSFFCCVCSDFLGTSEALSLVFLDGISRDQLQRAGTSSKLFTLTGTKTKVVAF